MLCIKFIIILSLLDHWTVLRSYWGVKPEIQIFSQIWTFPIISIFESPSLKLIVITLDSECTVGS